MRAVFERKIRDEVTVWTDGDVFHTPTLDPISLDRDKWEVGQKVRITIELIKSSEQETDSP